MRRVCAVALTPHVRSRGLLVSFAPFFGAYGAHGPLLLSLNPSLTMLAFTLGAGSKWIAAFGLFVAVNVPCHDDVTAEGVFIDLEKPERQIIRMSHLSVDMKDVQIKFNCILKETICVCSLLLCGLYITQNALLNQDLLLLSET